MRNLLKKNVRAYVHFMLFLNTMMAQVVEILPCGRQEPFLLCHLYHDYWWPGDARSQDINNHGIAVRSRIFHFNHETSKFIECRRLAIFIILSAILNNALGSKKLNSKFSVPYLYGAGMCLISCNFGIYFDRPVLWNWYIIMRRIYLWPFVIWHRPWY